MSRPNLLLFNPDQWRGDVLGHRGNPAAMTPNIDASVASDAVSFVNTFAQATVCTPSRCSFMTGWYPHVFGHRTMHHMLHGPEAEANLLRVLRRNGYFVWWGGKNDLIPGQEGHEADCDVAFRARPEDYERWGYSLREGSHGGDLAWRGEVDGDNFYSFYKGRLDADGADRYFDTDWAMVMGALDFIRNYDGDQPWCIFLPIGYPHPPYCVEDPWFSAIDRAALPERTVIDLSTKPAMQRGIAQGQHLADWDEDRWRELRATYYGMCARVDHQYGLLLDALREADTYDETAVFLFSDHGDYTGDYGLVEKTQNTFEDCLCHVPFVVKPPAARPARAGVREQLVELVDFPATVYDLAGIEVEHWQFGRSVAPMFEDARAAHRDAVFCEGGRLRGERQASEYQSVALGRDTGLYSPRIRLQLEETDELPHSKATMCRTEDFKYIRRLYGEDELYDLRADPAETDNLIDSAAHSHARAALLDRMLAWYQETCDIVPMQSDERRFVRKKTAKT